MNWTQWTNLLGDWWRGRQAQPNEVPDPAPAEAPKVDDPIDRSGVLASAVTYSPFCEDAPPPSPQTYMRMSMYSACALAYSATMAPVFAVGRSVIIRNADEAGDTAQKPPPPTGIGVQVTKSPEDKRKKLIEDVFETQWEDILQGLECYNFGNWLQEVVWGRKLGVTAPVQFKSFLPGEAAALWNEYKDFVGFECNQVKRDTRYVFNSVCNPQYHPVLGLARAEKARRPWWRSLKCHDNSDLIEGKASGRQMLISVASNHQFKDKNGNVVSAATAVQDIVNTQKSSGTSLVPLMAFDRDSIKLNPKLAEIPVVRVEKIDWGENGPALIAAIARLDRLDKEILRAWNRPERSVLEGHHGTLAEAGEHGDVAMTDSELVARRFYHQFNKQTLNTFLTTNFSPDEADKYYFRPNPMRDMAKAWKQQVTQAMLLNPATGPALEAHVALRDLLKEAGMTLKPENQVQALPPMPTAADAQGQPGGAAGGRMAGVGANGQGQPGGN